MWELAGVFDELLIGFSEWAGRSRPTALLGEGAQGDHRGRFRWIQADLRDSGG